MRSTGIGGAEILVKNIINSNSDDQFSHFMLFANKGPVLDQIAADRQKFLLGSGSKNRFCFVLELRKVIKSFKIQIVHCHQPIDVLYGVFASAGLHVKIVRTYHGFSDLKFKDLYGFSRQKVLKLFITRFVCLNLYVSKTVFNYFCTQNQDQLFSRHRLLYNGIDLMSLGKRHESITNQKFKTSENEIMLGMVGSFNSPARDQLLICEALKPVINKLSGIKFLFIGRTGGITNKSFDQCYRFCQENDLLGSIHFLGEMNNIYELFYQLDLYVHSSNYETFGFALIEAMACGVPCIASDIPTFREVSDDGKNVIMFQKGNANDLSTKIEDEISNLKSYETQERIIRAKDYVQRKFSIESHIKTLHSYYLECLK
jgi:glycosyltransferase involved in cell wall biosynthesis